MIININIICSQKKKKKKKKKLWKDNIIVWQNKNAIYKQNALYLRILKTSKYTHTAFLLCGSVILSMLIHHFFIIYTKCYFTTHYLNHCFLVRPEHTTSSDDSTLLHLLSTDDSTLFYLLFTDGSTLFHLLSIDDTTLLHLLSTDDNPLFHLLSTDGSTLYLICYW